MVHRDPERAEGPLPGLVLFAAATVMASAGAALFLGIGDEAIQGARLAGHDALVTARTSLEVRSVVGRILGGGTALDALNVTVGLAPGSDPVHLDHLVLELANGTARRVLDRGDAAGSGVFTVAAVRDAGGSIASARVLGTDDLASLDADLRASANDLLLPTREPLRIGLAPHPGAPVGLDLTTPPTYAGKTIVTLR